MKTRARPRSRSCARAASGGDLRERGHLRRYGRRRGQLHGDQPVLNFAAGQDTQTITIPVKDAGALARR